jgi:hypothetical protein
MTKLAVLVMVLPVGPAASEMLAGRGCKLDNPA